MELEVRDVSALLGVPEKTVYRWIAERGLPARRINDHYRFNRAEVLEWATSTGAPLSPEVVKEEHPAGLPRLAEALQSGGVHDRVGGADKAAVLAAVVQVMPLPSEVDRELLLDVLRARESLGSTGIGGGLAVPHVRNPIVMHISRPMVSLCYLETPVDFEAIDGQPVHTLFTIVSPTVRGHLHLLSRLSFALRQPEFRRAVDRRAPAADIRREAEAVDRTLDAASAEKGGI